MRSRSSSAGTDATAPQPKPGSRGDLRTRVVSALVLAPLVLGAVALGGWVFAAVLVAYAAAAAWEWTRLVEPSGRPVPRWLVPGAVVGSLAVAYAWGPEGGLLAAAALTVVAYGGALASDVAHPRLVGFGVPYVGGTAIALAYLRHEPAGSLGLFFFVLLAVWATDIGAYFTGRALGGPKLAPRFSPKKTWSGLIGGVVAAAAAGGATAAAFGARAPWVAVAVAAVLAVVAQIGDLFESGVKRRFGVKDSGTLIPGHGGLLDRVDGLVAAAAVAASFHAAAGERLTWW